MNLSKFLPCYSQSCRYYPLISNESKDPWGLTSLWASEKGHREVVHLLVDKGADIESNDCKNQTPLSRASEKGCEDAMQYLLDKGAEIESKEKDNRIPISFAAENAHHEAVQLLVENGANLETEDTNNCPPLIWACMSLGKPGDMSLFTIQFKVLSLRKIVRLLLDKGANQEVKDKNG